MRVFASLLHTLHGVATRSGLGASCGESGPTDQSRCRSGRLRLS